MKKVWLGILATLLLALFVAPAFAWEFSMTGEFDWRQNYISRMGTNDIFGDATLQDNGINPPTVVVSPTLSIPNFVGFAGPNYYTRQIGDVGFTPSLDATTGTGVVITRGGFSTYGDAAWIGDQRLTFRPAIQVNKAVRIFGVYTVGGFRNKYLQNSSATAAGQLPGIPPFERYHALSSTTSAYNTAAIGSWEQVRFTAQVPWGTIAIGIRDFPFGTGLSYAQNTPTTSALLVVPYGPFRLLFASMFSEQYTAGWGVTPDTDRKKNWRIGPGFTYENGPLSLGVLWLPEYYHLPRALNGAATAPVSVGLVGNAGAFASSADVTASPWNFFLKYNNGRFFANAEYYFNNVNTINSYSNAVTGHVPVKGLDGPRYGEYNKWMAEIGALCGPAKVTLMAAYSSGQVLPGVDVRNANSTFNATKLYGITEANYQMLQPYSYLMFPVYGGGNNRFNFDGTGQMGDAFALAARIDYAAAANLNLWGSYIHARRAEKNGYYAGTFNSGAATFGTISSALPTSAATAASPTNAALFKAQYGGGNMNPFVDDDFIGWEAQAGVDWKLLENFSAQFAYSYWQLGPWFDQAYQAFTANTPNGFLGNGILVGRDPIQSVRGSLTIDF